jgi:hypothetical protein
MAITRQPLAMTCSSYYRILSSITATLSEDFEGQILGCGREILLLPLLGRLAAEVSKPIFVSKGLILEPASSSSDRFIRIGYFRVNWQENV